MKSMYRILKNNALELLGWAAVFALVTAVFMLVIEFFAYPKWKKFTALSAIDADYAILFAGDYDAENTIIYDDHQILVYLEKEGGSPVSFEILMQKQGEDASVGLFRHLCGETLSADEIVLSESVAQKCRISENDVVYLDSGYRTERLAYRVRAVIDDFPSFFGADRSIAIVGYSSEYVRSVEYQTLYLYKGSLSDLVFGVNYIDYTNLGFEARGAIWTFLAFFFIYAFAEILLDGISIHRFERQNRARLLKLRRCGCTCRNIVFFKMIANFLPMCPIVLIPLVFSGMVACGYLLTIAGAIMLSAAALFACIVDIKCYRRIGGKR